VIINHPSENLEVRRKMLLWRAAHRGTKEMDLMLGSFVRENVGSMQPTELSELEALVALPDPQLLAWITGEEAVGVAHRNATTERLLAAYRVRSR
jgi:antitoxin CptB